MPPSLSLDRKPYWNRKNIWALTWLMNLIPPTIDATIAVTPPQSEISESSLDRTPRRSFDSDSTQSSGRHENRQAFMDTADGPSVVRTPPIVPVGPALPPPIVQVKLVSDKVGFRVFALQNFTQGERIYLEKIMLQATHSTHSLGRRNAFERYIRLPTAKKSALNGAFPVLAEAIHVDKDAAGVFVQQIGSRLLGGASADIRVTAEQHKKRMEPARRRGLARFWTFEGDRDGKKETVDWFSRYAFRLSPSDTFTNEHSQAGVYLLTSLLNHRCAGHFNCRVVTALDEIALIAKRNIDSEDELTINYGKEKKDFKCRGPCCQR